MNQKKKNPADSIGAGVGSLIAGIAGVILSIISMSSPNVAGVIMIVISVLFGLFIMFMGISNIILANIQSIQSTGPEENPDRCFPFATLLRNHLIQILRSVKAREIILHSLSALALSILLAIDIQIDYD